jgi:hypothetical protein
VTIASLRSADARPGIGRGGEALAGEVELGMVLVSITSQVLDGLPLPRSAGGSARGCTRRSTGPQPTPADPQDGSRRRLSSMAGETGLASVTMETGRPLADSGQQHRWRRPPRRGLTLATGTTSLPAVVFVVICADRLAATLNKPLKGRDIGRCSGNVRKIVTYPSMTGRLFGKVRA